MDESLRQRMLRAAKGRGGSRRVGVLDISKFEEVNFYKPHAGKDPNIIDIIPFIITEPWYPSLRTFEKKAVGLKPGEKDYKLEIPIHRDVGEANERVVCQKLAFGKRCPMCEDRSAEMSKDESARDKYLIESLNISWRCFYNIYDYDDPDKGIQIWESSYHLFEKYVLEEAEIGAEEVVAFADLDEGKTIEWMGKKKTLGKNSFIEGVVFNFADRDPYPQSVLEEVYPLDQMVIIPDYEEVYRMHLGIEAEEGEIEQPKEEAPATGPAIAGRRRRSTPVPEQESSDDIPPEVTEEKIDPPTDECPFGYEFGTDCNNKIECGSDCPDETFRECDELNARLKRVDEKPAAKRTLKRRTQEPTPDSKTEGATGSDRRRRRSA